MHIKKSMLVFAALIFASFSNICYAADMKWTYDEKTATVFVKGYGIINDATGLNQYLNKAKRIEIQKGVTKIDKNVFVDCGNVEEFVLPEGLTDIGDNSFSLSGSIKHIEMPDTLESIGSEAFMGCTELEDFILPKSLNRIGKNAFSECESIKEFKVSAGNSSFKATDGVVFSKDGSELILYPPGREETVYTVPDGVTKIHTSAFSYNDNLTDIILSDTVKEIDDYAFFFCESLNNIEFGSGLQSIGNYAFYGTKLKKAEIPFGTQKNR